jgi:hypothetical protein
MNWEPISTDITIPPDKLIVVSGYIFGDANCSRFYSFVKRRRFPNHFIDISTGEEVPVEYLTHWAPVDEVPE